MLRTKLALAMLVTVLVASFGADQAEAGWHHWGHGYYPYAYSYGVVYRPVVVAPVYHAWSYRPLLGHRWARWGWGCGYGYSMPGYAYWGSSCCWSGCYPVDPCCSGSVVVESQKAVVPSVAPEHEPADLPPELPPAPAEQQTPAVPEPADAPPALPQDSRDVLPALPDSATPEMPVPPMPDPIMPALPDPAFPLLPDGSASLRPAAGSAMLAVRVPADARVFVNGLLTRTQGMYRQYISRGLMPGSDYTYEVRVEVARDGRTYEDVRTVNLQAGGATELVFRMDQQIAPVASRQPAETSLMLHVPETARVILEGRSTEATGEVRTFVTRELRDSQRWDGYRVIVEFEQEGRVETSAKTIDLIGGGQHELSFDFSPQHVVMR
jgi:uncharacterized protein (TIGR03000 family)